MRPGVRGREEGKEGGSMKSTQIPKRSCKFPSSCQSSCLTFADIDFEFDKKKKNKKIQPRRRRHGKGGGAGRARARVRVCVCVCLLCTEFLLVQLKVAANPPDNFFKSC